jgi:hypothetical protein
VFDYVLEFGKFRLRFAVLVLRAGVFVSPVRISFNFLSRDHFLIAASRFSAAECESQVST